MKHTVQYGDSVVKEMFGYYNYVDLLTDVMFQTFNEEKIEFGLKEGIIIVDAEPSKRVYFKSNYKDFWIRYNIEKVTKHYYECTWTLYTEVNDCNEQLSFGRSKIKYVHDEE